MFMSVIGESDDDGSPLFVEGYQVSKYLKICTCPASQKLLEYMGKIYISLEISTFSLALQPEALVNTSGRVLFSSPGYNKPNILFEHL